ncbi:MAG: hypothetical protein LBO78_00475 [Rickettsiales bacterium]|jgi:hypothetical protein|nr:hypothetical protein [Rickettsiales bacterium]
MKINGTGYSHFTQFDPIGRAHASIGRRIKSALAGLFAKPIREDVLEGIDKYLEPPFSEYEGVIEEVAFMFREELSRLKTDDVRSAFLLRKFLIRISRPDFQRDLYSFDASKLINAMRASAGESMLPLHRDAFVWKRMVEGIIDWKLANLDIGIAERIVSHMELAKPNAGSGR